MSSLFSFPSFSFCTLPNRKIIAGFGEEKKISDPFLETTPLFFSSSFFGTEKQALWSTFSEVKTFDPKEFFKSIDVVDRQEPCWQWKLPEKEKYLELVKEAMLQIDKRSLKKLVPYTYAYSQEPFSKEAVASIIESAFSKSTADEYLLGFYKPKEALIALSPERLFSLKENVLETVSLAGTIFSQEPDQMLKTQKMALEQKIVTEEIANALKPFGRVEVEKEQIVKRGRLKHLQTKIFCFLNSSYAVEELVFALHPTPAVGGAPKNKALKWLSEHRQEEGERIFASPFGVFFPKEKEAHIYVCIRAIEWAKNTWKMGIGCGAVEGSSPTEEWKEVEKKFVNLKFLLGV